MGDSLRNYLAVDCVILKEVTKSGDCSDYHAKKIDTVINDLNRLMHK